MKRVETLEIWIWKKMEEDSWEDKIKKIDALWM